MTIAALITGVFFLGLILYAVYWVLNVGKVRSLTTATIENRTGVADAPNDYVEIVIVYPDKATARIGEWSVDGELLALSVTGDRERMGKSTQGWHRIAAKIGMKAYEYHLECPHNGRFTLHLTADRFRGGIAESVRLVASVRSA